MPEGGCTYFATERISLAAVGHIDARCFDVLAVHAMDKSPAERDFKYWGGAEEPWRDGTTDAAITDPLVIAREEVAKRCAEAEDAARCSTVEAHGAMLHGLALRVDFVLAFTFTLNLWEWKTWELVQFLIKPATEAHGRCRFADLPFVKPYTGPATVFLSHAWNGNWGDAVAAACQGARMDRFVWIDIAAVRQWPGNGADLDFRAVVRRSRALVVAAAPVPGVVSAKQRLTMQEVREYRASPEYKEATKTLAFCRLWCIVELYAGLEARKPIIFRCCAALFHARDGCYITITSGEEAANMLANFSRMVDVASAECAVPADKERELRTIGEGNFAALNRTVAGSMMAGAQAVVGAVWEVDAFNCGEPEALRRLPSSRLKAAMFAAGSAGQLASVSYLLDERISELGVALVKVLCAAMTRAAGNGHEAVVQLLLAADGVDVNQVDPSNGTFPLLLAAEQGHEAVVQLLLAAEGINVNQVRQSNGAFPLLMAAQQGHEAVVRLLLTRGADPHVTFRGMSLLEIALDADHADVVEVLCVHL